MKKLRIYLDSDEVLMDFLTPLIEDCNQYYNLNLKSSDIKSWEINESLPNGLDAYSLMNKEGFFCKLKPNPFAVELVQKLIEDGHDVFISTASHITGIMDKYESFKEHFPLLPFEQILVIKRKDILIGDIILDDALHNLEKSSCKHVVAMDKPWNKEYNGLRVSNLEEFYDLVCKIANE